MLYNRNTKTCVSHVTCDSRVAIILTKEIIPSYYTNTILPFTLSFSFSLATCLATFSNIIIKWNDSRIDYRIFYRLRINLPIKLCYTDTHGECRLFSQHFKHLNGTEDFGKRIQFKNTIYHFTCQQLVLHSKIQTIFCRFTQNNSQ